MADVAELIRRLYEIVDELEAAFPGRHFTPDGHLVGSIGEALAAEAFGLELQTASNEGFDALTSDGRRVEIKATQGTCGIVLQAHGEIPDVLVALQIDRTTGNASVVYNGPAGPVWEAAGKPQKNGQQFISLSKLRQLMAALPEAPTLQGRLGTGETS